MFYASILIATTAVVVTAREISFPPLSGFSSDQAVMGAISPDITQTKFEGLTTYANLPYVHCLAPEGADIEEFDIAILGAPFDTVSNICVQSKCACYCSARVCTAAVVAQDLAPWTRKMN